MPWRARAPLALALLAAALVLAVLAASASGAVPIPLRELPSLLWGAPTPEQALWRNVLIDIRLGRESGFDAARVLAGNGHAAALIMISTHADEDYAELIAESPAIGFLPKVELSAEAIRRLLETG